MDRKSRENCLVIIVHCGAGAIGCFVSILLIESTGAIVPLDVKLWFNSVGLVFLALALLTATKFIPPHVRRKWAAKTKNIAPRVRRKQATKKDHSNENGIAPLEKFKEEKYKQ